MKQNNYHYLIWVANKLPAKLFIKIPTIFSLKFFVKLKPIKLYLLAISKLAKYFLARFVLTTFFSVVAVSTVQASSHPPYSQAEQLAKLFHSQRIGQQIYNDRDLWDRISYELSLPHYTKTPEVQAQLAWFKKNKKFFIRTVEQGNPYLFYIYTEVTKRKLPGELILLPVIESAYDPFAHSWVGAAGLWQFMPATASDYGIQQNWWYDGRRDVMRSTEAALSHLNNLYKYFNGNWLHAIASYNSGAGTVQRAINKNAKEGKSTEFWSLPLPEQTREYVPRLLALAAIISDPNKHGFTLPDLTAEPYFAEVDVGSQIDLSNAAKMANISLNHLYQLNPGYNRWSTAPEGPHTLLLPVEKIQHFEKNIKQSTGKSLKNIKYVSLPPHKKIISKKIYTKPLAPALHYKSAPVAAVAYTVKSGDTLWRIAQNHQMSINEIRRLNHLNDSYRLVIGHQLLVKQASKHSMAQPQYADKNSDALLNNKIQSSSYPTSMRPVQVTEPVRKQPIISQATLAQSVNTLIPTQAYQVKKGDTLYTIASKYNMNVESIKKANALHTNTLTVGQRLYLPQAAVMMAHKQDKSMRYTVKKGDRLTHIAQSYQVRLQDLLAWNNLHEKSTIHPGQQLKIRSTQWG